MAPHSHLCIICMVLLLSCGASAVTISLSPDRIQRGDTVTVAVTDLPDGSVFSILVMVLWWSHLGNPSRLSWWISISLSR